MNKEKLLQDWENITAIKIFEIEVFNKLSQDIDYIIFDIFIDVNNDILLAHHESTTIDELESDKISFVSIEIDYDFSINENLVYLYNACTDKIIYSDFYELI
jgi:hypothetical protein